MSHILVRVISDRSHHFFAHPGDRPALPRIQIPSSFCLSKNQ
ncbi:hypothetical protein AVDCRST_MAG94-673 [uncultured Leptolyngbya sp.]|uniref:Uncharacterized protein n=1 Tax=uncultured Leptolyngbya sp. TaxID=332963 RepID=A0A6J4KH17_9CYAN|nr:hypothetical protein AVDCRST_MAG94-673 [uncultured Leptolyngbya sp.]